MEFVSASTGDRWARVVGMGQTRLLVCWTPSPVCPATISLADITFPMARYSKLPHSYTHIIRFYERTISE